MIETGSMDGSFLCLKFRAKTPRRKGLIWLLISGHPFLLGGFAQFPKCLAQNHKAAKIIN